MITACYPKEGKQNKGALLCLIRSIKFLCRQGLALRGSGDGLDGNLHQLLLIKAEQGPTNRMAVKNRECLYQP